jgi:hypothetical protein
MQSIFNLKSSIFNVDSFNLTLASGHGNPSRPAQVVGRIRSVLRSKDEAPRPRRGAGRWLDVDPAFAPALQGVLQGRSSSSPGAPRRREVTSRSSAAWRADCGVFAALSTPTRAGTPYVTFREISGTRLRIWPHRASMGLA